MSEQIDMRPLKAKAMKIGGPFMRVMVSQPDTLSREEYLTKAGDWLTLLESQEAVKE